jgi:ankyrin repeat protein
LEHGADPNWVFGAYYVGPGHHLYEATRHSSLEVVKLLLKHGAVIRQSGAFHLAAEKARTDVMKMLLDYGAEINEQLWEHNLNSSSSSRTKLKKSFGITSNVLTDRHNRWSHETPLHMSVLYQKVEATIWLVNHGADASVKDSRGWSAKDMAITMGDPDILDALGIPATMDE